MAAAERTSASGANWAPTALPVPCPQLTAAVGILHRDCSCKATDLPAPRRSAPLSNTVSWSSHSWSHTTQQKAEENNPQPHCCETRVGQRAAVGIAIRKRRNLMCYNVQMWMMVCKKPCFSPNVGQMNMNRHRRHQPPGSEGLTEPGGPAWCYRNRYGSGAATRLRRDAPTGCTAGFSGRAAGGRGRSGTSPASSGPRSPCAGAAT